MKTTTKTATRTTKKNLKKFLPKKLNTDSLALAAALYYQYNKPA